jgi:Tol biopolymer transport system component
MKHIKKNIFVILIMIIICTGCITKYPLGITKLTISPSVNLSEPHWSPEGTQIVGVKQSFSRNESAVYIVDFKSGKAKPIINTFGMIGPEAWSPDGSQIALFANGAEKFSNGIWIFNIKDNSSYSVGAGDSAAWSPDGKQLVIYSCTPQIWLAEIELFDFTTKNRTKLYSQEKCRKDAYLSWSPDGKFLAFSYSLDNPAKKLTNTVYILDISSRQIKSIPGAGNWSPAWSPDSKIIVFVKENGLALTDVTGTCVKELTSLGISSGVGTVSWSPDGTKWVISSLDGLFIIDVQVVMGEGFLENGFTCP